jgi:Plant organelle RNA recognition domain
MTWHKNLILTVDTNTDALTSPVVRCPLSVVTLTPVTLTPDALSILCAESETATRESEAATCRVHKLLAMSLSHRLSLRAIFQVWRDLGLPDNFEPSVIHQNPSLFSLRDNPKGHNTHIVDVIDTISKNFTPAIEYWRKSQARGGCNILDYNSL